MSEVMTQSAITMERVFAHRPEKVWRALTETNLIVLWLMPNDFQPVVGHAFSFRVSLPCGPSGDSDGIVHCEVLECTRPHRLRYSWKTCGVASPESGVSGLDTMVTWTLEPAQGGTLLRLVHDGFRPENAAAFDKLRAGWAEKLTDLGSVASGLA